MKTLSEQLTELYESKWNGLMEQLEANGGSFSSEVPDEAHMEHLRSLIRNYGIICK